MVTIGGAQAAGDAKYPDWKGQWDAINPRLGGQGVKFDPNKPFGPAQQAPLTPEYQKVHEESMADQAKGGQGNFIDHTKCGSDVYFLSGDGFLMPTKKDQAPPDLRFFKKAP